eukprot:gene7137-243_t
MRSLEGKRAVQPSQHALSQQGLGRRQQEGVRWEDGGNRILDIPADASGVKQQANTDKGVRIGADADPSIPVGCMSVEIRVTAVTDRDETLKLVFGSDKIDQLNVDNALELENVRDDIWAASMPQLIGKAFEFKAVAVNKNNSSNNGNNNNKQPR